MSAGPVRFSIALAFNPCEQWIPLARAAEEAGFDSGVVSDHLVYLHHCSARTPGNCSKS